MPLWGATNLIFCCIVHVKVELIVRNYRTNLVCCALLFLKIFFQVQGLPIGNLTIAEKSLLSDALYSTSRNKIRALIELSEVIVKALLRSRNTLTSKDAIEICKKIQEVYTFPRLFL